MKNPGELGRYGPMSMFSYGTIKHVEGEGNKSPYKRFNVFEKKYSKEKAAFLNDEGVDKAVSYMDTMEYDNLEDISLAEHIKQYVNRKRFYYEKGEL